MVLFVSYFVFFVAVFLYTTMMCRYRYMAVWIGLALLICYFFFKDSQGWGWDGAAWFAHTKTLSLFIPNFLFSLAIRAHQTQRWPKTASILLFFCYLALLINILEANLLALTKQHYLNALVGLIVALTTPLPSTWHFEKIQGLVSFCSTKRNLIWIGMYSIWNFLFVFHIADPIQGNILLGGQGVVMLLWFYCLYTKDFTTWITKRCYSLFCVVGFETFFPETLPYFSYALPPTLVTLLHLFLFAPALYIVYSDLSSHETSSS